MRHISLIIILVFFYVSLVSYGQDFSLKGFAAVDAEGYSGTTGGVGGDEITVYTGLELQDALNDKGDNPLIIYISGKLTNTAKVDVKDISGVSILGATSDAELSGFGLKIRRAENIIVRNSSWTC